MNPDEYTKMFQLEDTYWWFVGRRSLAVQLMELYGEPGNAKPPALDIGCGTGAATSSLARRWRVAGVDMNGGALTYSRSRGLSRLVLGDGIALPFANDSYDGAMGLDVFEHIEDDLAAFRECFRVLRPGGVLVLSVPAFRALWGPHDVALHHFRRYRRAEVGRKLELAGFQVERLSYSVFFLFPLVLVSRVLEKLRTGPPRASLPGVPEWLNRRLIALQNLEAGLIAGRNIDLPWGSSVVAVARKPRVKS